VGQEDITVCFDNGAMNYPFSYLIDIEFKSSPFYTIQQQLGETEECQGRGGPLSIDYEDARLIQI
jgi:hypothetical protein